MLDPKPGNVEVFQADLDFSCPPLRRSIELCEKRESVRREVSSGDRHAAEITGQVPEQTVGHGADGDDDVRSPKLRLDVARGERFKMPDRRATQKRNCRCPNKPWRLSYGSPPGAASCIV